MSRIRRYFVRALLLLPVIFICGKLLLTPVQHPEDFFGAPCDNNFEFGWPWSFRESQAIWNSQLQIFQPAPGQYFSPWWLAIDIGSVLFIVMLSGILIWRWGPRQINPRFSLRFLMLLIVVVALGCAWWRSQDAAYRHEQELAKSLPADQIFYETACCAPYWLQKLWPTRMPQIFDRVVSIGCVRGNAFRPDPSKCGPLLESTVPQFPYLRLAMLDGDVVAQFTDAAAFNTIEKAEFRLADRVSRPVHFGQFPQLKEIVIDLTPEFAINRIVLSELAQLKNLNVLNIRNGKITDVGMQMIARFPALESLTIWNDEHITDGGVRHLLESPTLNFVDLVEVPISRATLKLFETREPYIAINGTYQPR
jgi:hypothetical protein